MEHSQNMRDKKQANNREKQLESNGSKCNEEKIKCKEIMKMQ